MTDAEFYITHIDRELEITDLDGPIWGGAHPVVLSTYWNGEPAPSTRHAVVRAVWSDSHLYLRFDADQNEPLIVSETPQTTVKTMQLWERDVCEVFIAPDINYPGCYFEFEIAPTGEWLDIGIVHTAGVRYSDWEYSSGMETAARNDGDTIVMAIKLPWTAFDVRPRSGDVWLGNLFRCIGSGDSRGYLAWRSTLTPLPNFHVPDRFGRFVFVVSDDVADVKAS